MSTVQGYSDLMKETPDLMTSALFMHNAIIRKAKWENYGFTIEQEGGKANLLYYTKEEASLIALLKDKLYVHRH